MPIIVSRRLRCVHGKGLNLQALQPLIKHRKENQVILAEEINLLAQRIKRKRQLFWESYCIIQEVEAGEELNLKS